MGRVEPGAGRRQGERLCGDNRAAGPASYRSAAQPDCARAQAAALLVAKYIPNWEVIDYAKAGKPDVPSGTARELAERLSAVQRPNLGYPIADIAGPKEARGADVDGTRVHSVRLPSFVVSTEVVFGMPEERMTIRFDAGSSPAPYVSGTLLAAKAVINHVGLIRGLDTLLLS